MSHPKTREERIAYLKKEVKERVLILDGAMGTMIQKYKLQEEDYRGERFKNHQSDVKGNNELISLVHCGAVGVPDSESLRNLPPPPLIVVCLCFCCLFVPCLSAPNPIRCRLGTEPRATQYFAPFLFVRW